MKCGPALVINTRRQFWVTFKVYMFMFLKRFSHIPRVRETRLKHRKKKRKKNFLMLDTPKFDS